MHNQTDELIDLAREFVLQWDIDWDQALLLAEQELPNVPAWCDEWDEAAARQWSRHMVEEWKATHRG